MPDQNDICPTCGNNRLIVAGRETQSDIEKCKLYCDGCGTMIYPSGPPIVPYLVRACRSFLSKKVSETAFNDALIQCVVPPVEHPKESETTDGH